MPGDIYEWANKQEARAKTAEARIGELEHQFVKLTEFKVYVHGRLDAMGVPTHPNGPHSAAGCRIGDRLDIVERQLLKTEAERDYEFERKQVQMEGRIAAERQRDALLEAAQAVRSGITPLCGYISDAAYAKLVDAIALCETGKEKGS
jgi:hypothetical protein